MLPVTWFERVWGLWKLGWICTRARDEDSAAYVAVDTQKLVASALGYSDYHANRCH